MWEPIKETGVKASVASGCHPHSLRWALGATSLIPRPHHHCGCFFNTGIRFAVARRAERRRRRRGLAVVRN